MDEKSHILPNQIESLLSALSRFYLQEGKEILLKVIVNASTQVVPEYSYDNWDGGTYGHALRLRLPEELYFDVFRNRSEVQSAIAEDLNSLHSIENEFIEEVFLELGAASNSNWREESGVLIAPSAPTAINNANSLWDDGCYRVFLSHKSEVKEQTAKLKTRLELFGVSAFVAHEDIHPTKAWQDQIEKALHSMDAFLAIMTENFHDSEWTDQEVGFALARGVPVIALKLGKPPYGFLGKFQALSSDWQSAPERIVGLLIKHERMFDAYINALGGCISFDDGNILSRILPEIRDLRGEQIDVLIDAYNNNREIRGSFGFNGNRPTIFGDGLVSHLHRLGPKRYSRNSKGQIVSAEQIAVRKDDLDDEIPF